MGCMLVGLNACQRQDGYDADYQKKCTYFPLDPSITVRKIYLTDSNPFCQVDSSNFNKVKVYMEAGV